MFSTDQDPIPRNSMNLILIPYLEGQRRWLGITSGALLLGTLLAVAPACFGGHGKDPLEPSKPETAPHVATERTGTLETKKGLTLHLSTDLGSVKIVSEEPGSAPVVRFTVHIETDARGTAAQRLLDRYSLVTKATAGGVEITGTVPTSRGSMGVAQFWVEYEIAVPQMYNVDVRTEAGDIETQDIGGTASLVTLGGNIRAGNIGVAGQRDTGTGKLVAKLETQGGHIQVQDVAGDLSAFTAGGHVVTGKISGDAHLHSGGGHISAERIGGRAGLETDGGNISVGQAGGFVAVKTGGGQIDFGEVRGSVRAQTGGGGIRIMYVAGPMEVESSAGSICLTRVAGTVRAATAGGSIRAWINPDAPSQDGHTVRLAGASQLTSGNGDIVVFLPRNLAVDIDAMVESGGVRKIEADPALGMKMTAEREGAHGVASLNGGGVPLRLRTTGGTIKLQYQDADTELRASLIREQEERLSERGIQVLAANFEASRTANPPEMASEEEKSDWLDNLLDRLEVAFWGGVKEDPDEFRKHLIAYPPPTYPDIARRAGLQGIVRLQVRATRDGRVEVEKLLEGSPTLADAAMAAVKQWRVNPTWIGSKKAPVISTVTIDFRLH